MTCPELLTEQEAAGTWTLKWPWAANRRLIGGLLILIAMVGLGICAFGHYMAFVDGELEMLLLVGFASPIFVLLIGLGVMVAVNQTVLSLRGSTLSVAHEPIPWSGAFSCDIEDIEQIFTMEEHKQDILAVPVLMKTSGELYKLGHGFRHVSDALYVEHALEKRLALLDRAAMSGELDSLVPHLVKLEMPAETFRSIARGTFGYWALLVAGALVHLAL